ncbi:MAG TPA: murein biosynthesis integral membrane protein MurJ, partial [Deltaproteobacteria bacterium]|nr:murein biosynthesis integral membrane protein MurJ [Deltaproteobacteria bacterium]
ITEVLFMRGEFGAEASAGTAVALYYYALGLVPVSTSRILTSVFYSVKDTATPVWIAFFAFIVNAILCFLLVGPLGHAGLALATSLSSAVNMVALLLVLKKRFGRFGGRLIFTSALKSSVASLIMGGVIYLIIFKADFGVMGVTFKALLLASCLLIGFLVYIGTARALRTPEMTFLKGILRKRG